MKTVNFYFDENEYFESKEHFAKVVLSNIRKSNILEFSFFDINTGESDDYYFFSTILEWFYLDVINYSIHPQSERAIKIKDPLKFISLLSLFDIENFEKHFSVLLKSFNEKLDYFNIDCLLFDKSNKYTFKKPAKVESVDYDLESILDKSGLYFLYDSQKRLSYIGRSKNLKNRVLTSISDRNFEGDRIEFIKFMFTTLDDSYILEPYYISLNKPLLNKEMKSKKLPTTLKIEHNYTYTEFIKINYYE